MTEFEDILRAHRVRYPLMEPQDYGKLAFQSEFGPEHMIADPEAMLRYLIQEWKALGPHRQPILPEPIGNGLCRFHLGACTEEQLPLLAELFCRSAREHKGTREGLEKRLGALRGLSVPGMAEWLEQYEADGCPMVRHSQAFRDAYGPHYRVIKAEYIAKLGVK